MYACVCVSEGLICNGYLLGKFINIIKYNFFRKYFKKHFLPYIIGAKGNAYNLTLYPNLDNV